MGGSFTLEVARVGGIPNEPNAEVFSPPYLFRGPRPTISAAPSRVAYGTSFKVTTPNAAAIAKVSLIDSAPSLTRSTPVSAFSGSPSPANPERYPSRYQ